MRGTWLMRGLWALVLTSGSWASPSMARDELKLEQVTLAVKAPRREAHTQRLRRGVAWVLPLRVADPGRLEVKVGEQVLAECFMGWGEAKRLLMGPVEVGGTAVFPRVVNRRPGEELVEVLIPEELDPGSSSR